MQVVYPVFFPVKNACIDAAALLRRLLTIAQQTVKMSQQAIETDNNAKTGILTLK